MATATTATTPPDPTVAAAPTARYLVHVEARVSPAAAATPDCVPRVAAALTHSLKHGVGDTIECFEPYSVPLVADLRAVEAVRIAEAMPLAPESLPTAAGAADDSGVDADAIGEQEEDNWAVNLDTDLPSAPDRVAAATARIHVHVYAAAENTDEFETSSSVADGAGMEVDGGEVNPLLGTPIPPPPPPASTVADLARLPGAHVTPLPARDLDALWHQLVFTEPDSHALPLPYRLLHAAQISLHMAMGGVDEHLAPPTRTMLLHGPPGTGKTCLAHALANKLAVRLFQHTSARYLIQLDAAALLSRFFGESPKQINRVLSSLRAVARAAPSILLVLLIDEVESIAGHRHTAQAAAGDRDPADAARAVNALLTQLDKLRAVPNVLVLVTTNLPGAVDAAVMDRMDLAQFLGPPPPLARYAILRSSVQELMRTGILEETHLFTAAAMVQYLDLDKPSASRALYELAQRVPNASGRRLRKLATAALNHIAIVLPKQIPLRTYLSGLARAVRAESGDAALPTPA
ncbi:hypothetical protein GGF32_004609 [Allomyces javanicus]|nr:hypothetical protein GGF32_004609 [Allomyces javanicus]